MWLVALDALSNRTQIPAWVAGVIGMKEEAARAPLASTASVKESLRIVIETASLWIAAEALSVMSAILAAQDSP